MPPATVEGEAVLGALSPGCYALVPTGSSRAAVVEAPVLEREASDSDVGLSNRYLLNWFFY